VRQPLQRAADRPYFNDMLPKEIDQYCATDDRGGVHTVRVMQIYCMVGGTRSDESMRWVKSGRLRFIVDDEYEIEQEQSDPTDIRIPGIGGLTRS
jgi:hypothetical protein